jgi:hypothetical protein
MSFSLYVRGPLRGKTQREVQRHIRAFRESTAQLRFAHFDVVSPVEWDDETNEPPIRNLKDYVNRLAGFLERDFRLIENCDGVAYLDGAENSTGARLEAAHARGLGKPDKHYLTWITEGVPAAESILTEAQRIVNGPRRETYGHPKDHHGRTAQLWSAYLGFTVKPEDVGMLFILDKMQREKHLHKRDNLTDIAGYAQVVQLIHEAINGKS